ncbi:MAG: mechanosensitive ion channel [Pseudomonadota bacterium]|nr:mechanosensitive ion channel [Pseudomonadota bacterium]
MNMNMDLIRDGLNFKVLTLGTSVVTVGSLLIALLLLIGIWWFSGFLERSVNRFAHQGGTEPWKHARIAMLSRLLRYGVWLVGTLVALNTLGIDVSQIALLGSALAVGLGFGLQNIVSNFVSGIIILLERSMKEGDFVELQSGARGNVREIAMRYTRITSNDALDILVPNSEFINGKVINWTLDDASRRMHIAFGVAYGTPKELVREAGLAAAKQVAGVIENDIRYSQVWLVAYADSTVNYELVVWADRSLTTRPGGTHAKLMWALDDELARRKIEVAIPQRDLHMRSGVLEVNLSRRSRDAEASADPPPNPARPVDPA